MVGGWECLLAPSLVCRSAARPECQDPEVLAMWVWEDQNSGQNNTFEVPEPSSATLSLNCGLKNQRRLNVSRVLGSRARNLEQSPQLRFNFCEGFGMFRTLTIAAPSADVTLWSCCLLSFFGASSRAASVAQPAP